MYDNEIKDLIKQLGVQIRFSMDLDNEGYYIPEAKLIVLDTKLSELEQKKALLHELSHAAKHNGNLELYRATYNARAKMEREADDLMLRMLLKKYLSNSELETKDLNCIKFLECNHLDLAFENRVKEIIAMY
ncbi:ImmA/IrrE family metallo-endopeptidase [Enterococcus nangangensis]|uniref:ImmA/IrrE family metallo-endopeptidase n=1 Tax=Enterococcus nangangensis TaxID=2559926 RepID=UPI0010F731A7|nr:ImmA/IrrE family metallo-endopeptidase [Enterococcus nangangensis]